MEWEFRPVKATSYEITKWINGGKLIDEKVDFHFGSYILQLTKENGCGPIPAAVKVKETEDATKEAVTTTLRRAISFYSTIQAHDGHWPAESAGPLFFLPPLVHLNVLYFVLNFFINWYNALGTWADISFSHFLTMVWIIRKFGH